MLGTALILLQLGLGFVLLLGGADVLIRAAASIAKRFSISSLAIGMTIVAFGTSAPELMVTVDAALSGAPDIGVGNIVGSNIANLLLVVGVSAAICPIVIGRPPRFNALVLVAVSLTFTALAMTGVLEWWAGLILVAGLAAFLVSAGRREQRHRLDRQARDDDGTSGDAASGQRKSRKASWRIWVGVVAGLIGIVFGANLLVDGSVALARAAGVSEAVIGLTLIAVGTSLPELAASVTAALRRHPEICLGNVIGSNIFNMLCVAGIAAVAVPLPVAEQIRTFDLWIMLAATAALFPFLFVGWRIGRIAGIALVLFYMAYIAALMTAGGAQAGAV